MMMLGNLYQDENAKPPIFYPPSDPNVLKIGA
jgi:hypothetical protein